MLKVRFVAVLMFLLALAGILAWLQEFIPYASFTSHARIARATAASRSQQPGATMRWFGEVRHAFPLRFTTDSGRDVLVVAFVPQRVVDRLELEGSVAVHYLPDEPQAVLFDGDVEAMPRGWKWLLSAVAALLAGIVAVVADRGGTAIASVGPARHRAAHTEAPGR